MTTQPPPLRRALGIAVLVAVLGAGSACDAAPNAGPSSSPASGNLPAGSDASLASTPTGLDPQTVECGDAVGDDPPSGAGTMVLDAIELPIAPGHPALHAEPDGEDGYFAKTGIAVRTDTSVRLTVSAEQAGAASIGWGSPGIPTTDLTIDCPGQGTPPGEWVDFAGGYYVDAPMCLTLSVTSGGRTEEVAVGVGVACPGQSPPA